MSDKEKVTIALGFEIDESTLKKSQNKIVSDSKETGRKAGDGFSSSFGASILNTRTLVIGAIAAIGAAFSASKLIDAAAQQEDAINSLNSALVATGRFSEATSSDLQSFASSLQEVTRYGDETILELSGLIQSLGNLSTDGLKEATKAALDFAVGVGVDARTAANLLGRAASGNVALFTRYGVAVKVGADNTETLSNAISAINEKFGGAAQRDVETYSGAVDQLSNAFGDLQEDLGFVITKADTTVSALGFMSKAVNDVRLQIAKLSESNDVNRVSIVAGLNEELTELKRRRDELVADPELLAFVGTEGLEVQIAALETKIAGEERLLEIQKEKVDIANQEGSAADQVKKEAGALIAENSRIEKSMQATATSVNKTINQGLAKSISGGIQTIVTAVAAGENAFGAFAKFLATTFGDMAIQMGTVLIGAGIGIDAMKGLVGGEAIAAGIGLVAFGAVLKAFSGGSSSSSGVGSASAGTSSATDAGIIQEEQIQEEAPEQGAAININIQGDVLDSDASGLRIVELINQATDTENVTIRRNAVA